MIDAEQIYALGAGSFRVTVRLERLKGYTDGTDVIYEGAATMALQTIDRSKQSAQIRRIYPIHDFHLSFEVPNGVSWAECARSDMEKNGVLLVEDYLATFLAPITAADRI